MKAVLLICLNLVLFNPLLNSSGQDETLSITLDDLIRDSKLCPREVVLKKRSSVIVGPGSIVYEANTRLQVVGIDRENVHVRVGTGHGKVALADTNLLEQANASFSVIRLRQRLIDEAAALPDVGGDPAPPVSSSTPSPTPTAAIVDLEPSEPFSDEFVNPGTLSRWKRITESEGWNIDTMENKTVQEGILTLIPYTQAWYEDYRGELFYQFIEGDFEIKTLVGAYSRDVMGGLPKRQFSLAGLMVRAPRKITPETWTPGAELYTFLGVGVGEDTTKAIIEHKITSRGKSDIKTVEIGSTACTLKIVRIGKICYLLAKPSGGGPWQSVGLVKGLTVEAVQVGYTAYTDWPTAKATPVGVHNKTVLTQGNPDLRAMFDFVRITRPTVPVEAANRQLTDEEAVRFFGK